MSGTRPLALGISRPMEERAPASADSPPPHGTRTGIPSARIRHHARQTKIESGASINVTMKSPEISLASGPRRGSTAKVSWRRAPVCHACGFALNALNARREHRRGHEVGTLISPCDPPRNSFGLSRSSDLTATLAGPGAMLLKWKRGKGAECPRHFCQNPHRGPVPRERGDRQRPKPHAGKPPHRQNRRVLQRRRQRLGRGSGHGGGERVGGVISSHRPRN